MCTRFYIKKTNAELLDIMEAAKRSALTRKFLEKLAKPLLTEGEIRPTDLVPVIASNQKEQRAVFPMKWGFTLHPKGSPLVNARVETAAEKPTFREAWERRRCVIPASWYFEWEHFTSPDGKTKTGAKYMLQSMDSTVTWLCGLYRFEDDLPVFTVLTREPGEELIRLHDRMPLILPADKVNDWIRPSQDPTELLSFALTDMVMEKFSKNC